MLAPRFIAFKHVLVDGPSLHSEQVFPALRVNAAARRVGNVTLQRGDAAEAQRPQIEAALSEVFGQVKKTDRGVMMPSSSRVISAVDPG